MIPSNHYVPKVNLDWEVSNIRGCPDSPAEPALHEPTNQDQNKGNTKEQTLKRLRNLRRLKGAEDKLSSFPKTHHKYVSRSRLVFDDRYVYPRPIPMPKERPPRKTRSKPSTPEEPSSKKAKVSESALPTPPDSPVREKPDQAIDSDYETYCDLATIMYSKLR